MVKYAYDAWGNCLETVLDSYATDIANLNPFRKQICYINLWKRLDYAKSQAKGEYMGKAWLFYSEYSLHMYGWFLSGWSRDLSIPFLSWFAKSCRYANVEPYNVETGIRGFFITLWGILGY